MDQAELGRPVVIEAPAAIEVARELGVGASGWGPDRMGTEADHPVVCERAMQVAERAGPAFTLRDAAVDVFRGQSERALVRAGAGGRGRHEASGARGDGDRQRGARQAGLSAMENSARRDCPPYTENRVLAGASR